VTIGEVQQLKAYIALTAAYYGQELADAVVAMYAEDLSDLPLEAVKAAITQIRRDPKVTRFPLPAVIRARLEPPETAEDAALRAEAEIWEAVARIGQYRGDEAEARLGGLAWEGVKRMGGWANVCRSANEDAGMYRAQMRRFLEAAYRTALAGRLNSTVALPEPDNVRRLALGAFKQLPGGE